MILTVTANTTIDHTVFVPSLKLNERVITQKAGQSVGGKPTNVSWFLHEMGIPTVAIGFAAGNRGEQVEKLLNTHGVSTNFVWVGGESRINTVIIAENGNEQTTVTTSTLQVSRDDVLLLKTKYQNYLRQANCVVIGGTLPKGIAPSFYVDLVRRAHEKFVPVVVDVDEPNLSAVITARPTFIKPNRDELSRLSGEEVETIEDAYRIGKNIQARFGTSLIVTLGGDGALAILKDRSYLIPPLNVPVVSAAGAGDGVVTGLAIGLSYDIPIEEGLRTGFAIASAGLTRPGTADLVRSDVERLLPQIQLLDYP